MFFFNVSIELLCSFVIPLLQCWTVLKHANWLHILTQKCRLFLWATFFFCFLLSSLCPCVNVGLWQSSYDQTPSVSFAASEEKQSSECHICLLPRVENHYNWEERWRKPCQNTFGCCIQTGIVCSNKYCRINQDLSLIYIFFTLYSRFQWDLNTI